MNRRSIAAFCGALALLLSGCRPSLLPLSQVPQGVYSLDTMPDTPQDDPVIRELTTPSFYLVESGALMAGVAQLPEDVTGQYAGQYSIPADAQRGYAFRITLDSLTWEDGTDLTAQQLSQALADEPWLAGSQALREGWEQPATEIISLKDAGFSSMEEAKSHGYHRFYVNLNMFWGLDAGWVSITDNTRLQDYAMPAGLLEYYVTGSWLYQQYLADGRDYARWQDQYLGVSADPSEKASQADLGLLVTGQRELVLICQDPTTASWIANRLCDLTPLRSDGKILSYGPYRVAEVTGNQITLERNPAWSDQNAYPADTIVCTAS